jgi:hypothetical protein
MPMIERAHSGQGTRSADAACIALVVAEVAGTALMWAAVPFLWFWVGERIGSATGSFGLALAGAFGGFVATVIAVAVALQRLDDRWVLLRRRASHDQRDGALPRVVVVSATIGLLVFFVWYYALSRAFIIPFMPSR